MAAVGHLKFSNFRVYVTWPLSPCYSGSLCKMSLKSDNWLLSYDQNRFLKWRPSAILYFKNFHIWSLNHLTVTKYAFVYQISSKSDNLVYKTCKKLLLYTTACCWQRFDVRRISWSRLVCCVLDCTNWINLFNTGWCFVEISRWFFDLQNGGRPPSWILGIQ